MVKSMNIALGIGIAIILTLVVVLGVETFYPSPEREDYCKYDFQDFQQANTKQECEAINGTWNENFNESSDIPKVSSRCSNREYQKFCSEKLNQANNKHSKGLFFIINIIAIIFIIASLFIMSIPNLSSGIAFSGIALFVYGFIRGWNGTEDVWKFLTGVIIAGLLIWFAIVVNKRYEKSSKK